MNILLKVLETLRTTFFFDAKFKFQKFGTIQPSCVKSLP